MRANFQSIEMDPSGLIKLSVLITPKKWDILHYTGTTEFDIYVADDMPIDCLITGKILEENGFKLEEVGDNGIATPSNYRYRFEKWVFHSGEYKCVLFYDRYAKYYHIQGLEAAHLHTTAQLQRALYLIGFFIHIDVNL